MKKETKLLRKLFKLIRKMKNVTKKLGVRYKFVLELRGAKVALSHELTKPPSTSVSTINRYIPLPKDLKHKFTKKQLKIEKKLDKLQKKYSKILKKPTSISDDKIKQLLKERLLAEAKQKLLQLRASNKLKRRSKKKEKIERKKGKRLRCQQEGCKHKEVVTSRTKDLIACTQCLNDIHAGRKKDSYKGYSQTKRTKINKLWKKLHLVKKRRRKHHDS